MRWRRTGQPFRAPIGRPRASLWSCVEIALGVVMCIAIGQEGHCSRRLHRRHLRDVPPRPGGPGSSRSRSPSRRTPPRSACRAGTSDEGILFGTMVATLAVWGISQSINRNTEVLAGARGERPPRPRRRAQPLRPRPPRHPRPLPHRDHGEGRAGQPAASTSTTNAPGRSSTDLERLSRDALADVRRAVDGYRELTLPGELARARTALSAAEIAADLPNSTDDVPTDRRELFAWTVREGITNVIRHSGARRCTVLLGEHEVEIRDDGRGPESGAAGHGLTGLRERAAALGGHRGHPAAAARLLAQGRRAVRDRP